jgi:large exoprotein involved in heme utilization and adhesion
VMLAEGGGISGLNVASPGAGGTVIVQASDTLAMSGVGSRLSTASLGPGAGGDIIIHAGTLSLTDGTEISAASLRTDDATASGNAGNVTVTVGKSLLIQDSFVTTEATQADGGNITLRVQDMIQLRNSEITAMVGGGPATVGGNITIDPQFVILEGSRIIANAFEGRGGNIRIEAGVFLADPNSRVDASSALGIQGTVDIQAPVTNLSGALAPLPQVPVTVAELLPARCAARLSGGTYSSLVLAGREGLPFDPGGPLPSPLTLDTEVEADPTRADGPRQQNPTSRLALPTIADKLFPRMRGSNATGSLQMAPELGCSTSLGERQTDLRKSR